VSGAFDRSGRASANRALIQRFYEAVSGKDKPESLLAGFVSDRTLLDHILAFEDAFPRYTITAHEMIAEGDRVAVRVTIAGTHGGPFHGIAPSGRPVTIDGVVFYTVRDGWIVDHWLNSEPAALLHQLGSEFVPPNV
jgi:predicted ester cyclase